MVDGTSKHGGDRKWKPRTEAVRGGLARSANRETAEALFLTSGFVYDDAAEAEQAFANKQSTRFVYSRFGTDWAKA